MKQEYSLPPKYAQKVLQNLIKSELLEEVLGDLEEQFLLDIQEKTVFKARLNYWYQTFNYFRPFAIKNTIITDLNPFLCGNIILN